MSQPGGPGSRRASPALPPGLGEKPRIDSEDPSEVDSGPLDLRGGDDTAQSVLPEAGEDTSCRFIGRARGPAGPGPGKGAGPAAQRPFLTCCAIVAAERAVLYAAVSSRLPENQ